MNNIGRVGEMNYNTYNSKMTIVEYYNYSHIVVEFDNGYKINAQYGQFKKGNIKNPYDKTVYGVGYLGEGKYRNCENGKATLVYDYWHSMLQRCYEEKYRNKKPAYKDKLVCNDWHNFQVFAEWFENNYYTINNEVMCLDKDILHKGNKIYSSETCCFVPSNINLLFTNRKKLRGTCPIGVTYHKRDKVYEVNCSTLNGKFYLGRYYNSEQAFKIYKTFKEKYIKQVAEEYKNKIPIILYKALYKYVIDITD